MEIDDWGGGHILIGGVVIIRFEKFMYSSYAFTLYVEINQL
jgi:hypothetical protein